MAFPLGLALVAGLLLLEEEAPGAAGTPPLGEPDNRPRWVLTPTSGWVPLPPGAKGGVPMSIAEAGQAQAKWVAATGGGTLGGLTGGAAVGASVGGAVGSAVPVVGTTVGAGLGAAAGAFIGSLAGYAVGAVQQQASAPSGANPISVFTGGL